MSETKVAVPEGMLKAAYPYGKSLEIDDVEIVLEAALRWLSENPIVPADGEAGEIWKDTGLCNEINDSELCCVVAEWQRRMFRRRETAEEQVRRILVHHSAPPSGHSYNELAAKIVATVRAADNAPQRILFVNPFANSVPSNGPDSSTGRAAVL